MTKKQLEALLDLLADFESDYLGNRQQLRNDTDCVNASYGLNQLVPYIDKIYLEKQDRERKEIEKVLIIKEPFTCVDCVQYPCAKSSDDVDVEKALRCGKQDEDND